MKGQTKVAIEAIYPLAPMQQGMLFDALYHSGVNTDFVQQRYILRGDLDSHLLRAAWSQVLARHAILRTQFRWEDVKQPLQIVWRECELPWLEYDWSDYAADKREERLSQLLQDDFARGGNLKKAPLFRLTLVRLSDDVHHLIWSYHHILLDGWSNDLVLREVSTLYEAGLAGTSAHLPTNQPYKNYITWQQRQDTAQAEQYWHEMLAGFQSANRLRVDHAPADKTKRSVNCREVRLALSPQTTARMETFKQHYLITANTLVQAAWAYLISCYSGDQDVVFGSVVAGRPGEVDGIDSMVGLFINTLPTRVRIDHQSKILPWLHAFQDQQLDARQFEHCSLGDILRWSGVSREEPLFESIVAFANYSADGNARQVMGNVLIEPVQASIGNSAYPLVLAAGMAEQFVLTLTYDQERFALDTMTRMLGHMRTLLEKMLADPMQPLAALSLLTRDEEQMMLRDWNDNVLPYPEVTSIIDLFKAQVKEHPAAVALVFASRNQHLTYAALDSLAQRLAYRLQQAAVGPETLVGICVDRSLEMIVAVLGVLYAGGAYVPLDPAYPEDRLAYMCEDAHVAVLITQQQLATHFEAQAVPLVLIEDVVAEAQPAQPVQPRLHLDNLAYVIYTSGSTGRSKGVMVGHRGLCNLVGAGARAFGQQKGKRAVQYSSLSFDASVWEAVLSVGMGATLVLAHKEELLPGSGLQEILRTYGVTAATLTPSVLAAQPHTELPELETIIAAGEACPAELVLKWGQERHFYNAYGPTETTVCASAGLCLPDGNRPTIGSPIANMQLYILDPLLRPLPIGVPGELYIGGTGLARGYLGRPDLTAERFVPHPFAQAPGARLYKTGDLACWHANGQVEFLGRLDNQTKLRGFRIELGEIEIVIDQLEEIEHSVVVAREDVPGDKRLVAYLMPKAGRQIDPGRVQDYLRGKLPYYMVPSALVVMDTLPLSPNGKVDQRKLPAPSPGRTTEATSIYQPPRDTFELQLVQIYEDLLNVRPIGILDDFFALGGHSLLAVRLMSEIQKRLRVQVALSAIFEHGSIAHLATTLRNKEAVPQIPLVAIRSGGSLPPLFFVHPANGQVACYYRLASHLPEDQPFYGLQDLDIYHQDGPERSIEEMAAGYIEAIRAVQPEGPYYLGGYSFGGIVAFEMAQQLKAVEQEVALLAILDSASPDRESMKLQQPTELLATIVGEAARKASGKTIQDVYNEMQGLSFEQQLEHAMELLSAANVELLVMEKDWLREQVELFARRLRATHRYHAHPYSGRIVLFRATEIDGLESEDEITEDQGWQQFSLLPLDIRPISGYHNTMINEPHVHDLAMQLQSLVNHNLGTTTNV